MERFEHGGNIYQKTPAGEKWLDFSANINPLGLSKKVRQALTAHLEEVIHYPQPEGEALRQKIAAVYQLPAAAVILGNGAAELFYLYMHTFRPQKVVIPVPSFNEYERAARAVGAEIRYLYLQEADGFAYPWQQLKKACAWADCLLLGQPNNPTGTLARKEDLLALLEVCQKQQTDLLVDESFLDFLPDAQQYSLLTEAAGSAHLFVLRSLTKFYALPGLRLGFGALCPQRRQQLEAHKDCWNVNLLAQYAGLAALADREYQQQSQQYLLREKEWFYQELRQFPALTVYPPSVNFIFWRLQEKEGTAAQLAEKLRPLGILIRDCANYPGLTPAYGRIAVRTHRENKKFLQVLHSIL